MKEKKFIFRLKRKLCQYGSAFFIGKVQRKLRTLQISDNISIISSNCNGGVILHDLGKRFNTPTINLFFDADDFVKFCSNLEYYIKQPLVNVEFDVLRRYPVGTLDDIKLNFVHYNNCSECIDLWNKRRLRVDFNHVFLMFTDRNGLTLELLKRFLEIPYRKVVFVSKKSFILSSECIYIPGFEDNGQVCELTKFVDPFGHRYIHKYMNIEDSLK